MHRRKKTIWHNDLKNFQFDWNKIVTKIAPAPEKQRAVIYCRVSSDRQIKEGFGLDTQEILAQERCEKQSPPIEIVAIFKEWKGVSWYTDSRIEFDKLLAFIKKENEKYIKITHFVCRELSRISRPDLDDVGKALNMEWQVKQYWLKIIDIGDDKLDDTTDEWKLLKVIKYALAWYERKNTNKRCTNGRRWRLLDWYRPFPAPPLGYKRINHWEKKGYTDEVDEMIAPILKQWLEMFANDPSMSQSQLYHFLIDSGLKWPKKNKNKDNKIYRTYLEKMFQLHRLYYYAGYIVYPSRDINELVEWRHIGIISLATANAVKDKLIKGSKGVKVRKDTENDEFVLKQLIECKWCQRKLTGWVTTKPNKKQFKYYGCQVTGCPEKANIPKDYLETTVLDMIRAIQLPPEMIKLFEAVFDNARKDKSKDWKQHIHAKEQRLKQLTIEKEKIEKYLLRGTAPLAMEKSLNEKRAEYDAEQRLIWETLENQETSDIERKNILQKTRELICSPLAFRELWDLGLRKMLVSVRFWDCLFHTKDGWLQTSETPSLYSVLCELKDNFTRLWVCRDSNPGPKD